jgi:hypothetical protein
MPLLGQLAVVTAQLLAGSPAVMEFRSLNERQLTRIDSLVFSSNGIALDIEEIPGLVQLAAGTADIDLGAVQLAQSSLNLAQSVGLGVIRGDASIGKSLSYTLDVSLDKRDVVYVKTYLVGIQTLEEIDGLLEKVADLLLRRVVGIAVNIDGVDTSAMLSPLVLPEGLVVAIDVDPVVIHIGE